MPILTVGKTKIPYTIRRSDRAKRNRIVVTPEGVEVVAPIGRVDDDVEAFVYSRRRWVHDEREKMQENMATSPWPEHFVSGAKIPYRGRRMLLRVTLVLSDCFVTGYRNGFEVKVPHTFPPEERDRAIKHTLTMWLRQRVRTDAETFVRRYSKGLGQTPKDVRIKDQKHIWGSCGKDNIINLNWRLIFMPKAILEYAVVHELCHLKHRNHSTQFWAQVKTLLPDYEARKTWLEKHGSGFDL